MYSYLYSFIQKLILKKSLNSDAASLLKNLKIKNIIDIGCGESDIFNYYKLKKIKNILAMKLKHILLIN